MNRFPRLWAAGALLALMAAALSAVSCRPTAVAATTAGSPSAAPGWPRTMHDDSGQPLTLKAPPRRIVSLAPSNTEILFAVGAGSRVVADTESCDYPAEAKQRVHIGGMSAGDLEKIEVQFPDLVVTVGSINQKLITALRAAHIPTLVVQPRTTDQVEQSIRTIGAATGDDAEADRIAGQLKQRLDRLRATTARASARPKVLIAYSAGPIYTSPPDSFIHDLIETAGGHDVVQSALPQNIISPAAVVERAPDVIICGAALESRLRALPGLSVTPAVRSGRFFHPSSDATLTRPGPRMAEAAEELARYIHPELFASGSAGAAR